MKGRLVTLERPLPEDAATIAGWTGPTAPSAPLSADASEFASGDDVADAIRDGVTRFFMIRTGQGRTVGVVHWRRVGQEQARRFFIGGAVGEPELWNKGFGGEALLLVIDHLFHIQNAHRVEFITGLYNKYMTMALTKEVGPMLEGVLRDYHYLDGCYHDAAMWSILRSEYYQVAAHLPDDVPGPMIPEADKAEARATLARYLSQDNETSLSSFSRHVDATPS